LQDIIENAVLMFAVNCNWQTVQRRQRCW